MSPVEDVAETPVKKGMRAMGMWSKRRDLDEQTVRDVLAAALDVEEMARVISAHRHGSTIPWPEDIRTAEVLRAAILGGAA